MTSIHRTLTAALLIWLVVEASLLSIMMAQSFVGFDWKPATDTSNAIVVEKTHLGTPAAIRPGAIITALATMNGPWIAIDDKLLIEDADSVPTYAQYDAILDYNRKLYDIISQPSFRLKVDGAVVTQAHQSRPLASIPYGYWISALVSLTALLVGAGIWTFQKTTLATRFLLLSGALYSFGALLTIFYSHRHLAMSPFWFEGALAGEHLLMGAFPWALLALLLSYPKQVVGKPALAAVLITPLLFWLNEMTRFTELPFHAFYMNTVIALILAVPSAIMQWRAVRGHPVEVAGLRWFLISIFTAPLIGVGLYLLPPFFGSTPQLPLWAAHLIFLTLYLGFSLGVARYRLFDIERWWFKIWIWFVSGILLMVADFVLASVFNLETDKAMMLAIVALAWIYFPLRQRIWKRLSTVRESQPERYLPMLVDAVLEEDADADADQHWIPILATAFQPADFQRVAGAIDQPRVIEHGLFLDIPAFSPEQHLRFIGRSDGSRLFSLSDKALATSLFELLGRMREAHTAHQRGARLERNRIIRDLHDDVGANLLTLTYRADTEEQAELARNTLKMLRETIYALDDNAEVYLRSALAEWFAEAQNRAQSANIELEWSQDENLPNTLLKPRQRINLGRVLREGVSNAIKHGSGKTLCVCIDRAGQNLRILIENLADAAPPENWKERNGMNNIRNRANELGGNAQWRISDTEAGAKASLCVTAPLF